VRVWKTTNGWEKLRRSPADARAPAGPASAHVVLSYIDEGDYRYGWSQPT